LLTLPPGPVSVPGVVPGAAGPTGIFFFPSGPGMVTGLVNASLGTMYFTGFPFPFVTVPGVVPGPATSTGTCSSLGPGIDDGVEAIESFYLFFNQLFFL